MRFSILVPVYNGEQYITRAVTSVRQQTFMDWELIIVNDGSTDKTLDICNKLKEIDSRIIVVDKENSGVSDSRNKAIEISRGDYIVFLDADDMLTDNCLEEFDSFIKEKQCQLVIGNYYVMRMNRIKNPRSISQKNDIDSIEEIFNLIEFSLKMIVWEGKEWYGNLRTVVDGKCFCRKTILDNNIRFVSDLKYGEDMVFLLIFLTHVNKISFIEKRLYIHTMNAESSMHVRKWEGFSQGRLYFDSAESIVRTFCNKHSAGFDVEGALGALWLETAKADWDCIIMESISGYEKHKLIKKQLDSINGVRYSKKNKSIGRRQALYMFFVRNKLVLLIIILCYVRMIKRKLSVQNV